MNLTLSVDEKLIQRARRLAQRMGKSLNQIIREYLEQLTSTGSPAKDIEELKRLTKEGKGRSRGWRFSRDEVHERS